ncbi:MAG: serine/threonine protein phosphatase [Hyphomicrobiales bacterium]|nr:serine/threonine protein phosphatase [Hyphomicrobiales bacterium]
MKRALDTSGSQPPAEVPEGLRIYAVGDIHGREDLLIQMHALIRADARFSRGLKYKIVYLGDYVDRGAQSFDVIETLLYDPFTDFKRVFLKGNHEEMMLNFIAGPPGSLWTSNGGLATLASYGVIAEDSFFFHRDLAEARRSLIAALPPAHRAFLNELRVYHTEGDYLFVHAGIRPGTALGFQDDRDLLWIRDPFLSSDADFGKRVVHGHTITAEPEVRHNRIGIDTGAFSTGRLTCLVLEGNSIRFLQT